ncbi:hypothetical protein N7468_003996 [Penicillium chermesinum]|uniref:Uncharacterized protein n=1 Tax=Penicillium chermesinum TaxID=63820 RepID=A0A9W9TSC0_9EURO|nr:uncharacterized protein N7468_003996 [Penicillium chermesinum]KAJ5239377.1 hypothetical protein N7468_003996 [Penicillium chermesinum]
MVIEHTICDRGFPGSGSLAWVNLRKLEDPRFRRSTVDVVWWDARQQSSSMSNENSEFDKFKFSKTYP